MREECCLLTKRGKATTKRLAEYGAHVIMACRSQERAEQAIAEIKKSVPKASLEFLELDLSDIPSIKKFVGAYNENHDHLDVLVGSSSCLLTNKINNAGMVSSTYSKGKIGHSQILEVNHLGPTLLSLLLKPTLGRSSQLFTAKNSEKAPEGNGGPRVVMVSSGAHKFMKGKLDQKIGYNAKLEGSSLSVSEAMEIYGMTKLCNLLFAKGWAEELKKEGSRVTCYSIHPGWVATELSREAGDFVRGFEKIVARTPEEGAVPSVWCACESLSNSDLISGEYYTWIAEVGDKNKKAKNKELAEWLLTWSKDQLKDALQ